MAKKKQFVVLGLGRFGLSVAKSLSDNGFEVMAVDINAEKVHIACEFVTHAVRADISEEAALRSLGLGNFDVAVISISNDMEASMMATLRRSSSQPRQTMPSRDSTMARSRLRQF